MSATEPFGNSNDVSSPAGTSIPGLTAKWRIELREMMGRLADALKQALAVETLLGSFASGVSFDLLPHKIIHAELWCWVRSCVGYVNGLAENNTHARLQFEQLSDVVRDFDYPRQMNASQRTVEQLVKFVVERFPIDKLATELVRLSEQLETHGLNDAAEKLGNAFSLFEAERWHQAKELSVKGVRGKFLLSYRNYGRSYDRAQSTARLQTVAKTFESASGLTGLARCFASIARAEEKLGWGESIPSRTRFCEGDSVDAVYFNEEIKLYLAEEIFHALIAFIKTNTSRTLRPLSF